VHPFVGRNFFVPKSKFTHCQKLELTTNKKMVTPAGSYFPANVTSFTSITRFKGEMIKTL
uniref:hypothetical protein n=1 Tax=Ruminococcus bicirculans (ex Wegman et al. 2014) TaxID=1160721 RepID=UPI0040286CEC